MTQSDVDLVAALREASHQLALAADALAREPRIQAVPSQGRPDLLRIEQTSELTGLSVHTLRAWRQSGKGPQATRIGGLLFWDRSEVEAWIQAQFSSHAG